MEKIRQLLFIVLAYVECWVICLVVARLCNIDLGVLLASATLVLAISHEAKDITND